MKAIYLFLLLIISVTAFSQKKYRVSRYEETPSSLFICINSTVTPSYVEHFFSDKESNTPEARKATIERLVAQLQLKDEEYKEQEKAISIIREAEKIVLDTAKIRLLKLQIIEQRDSVKVQAADSTKTATP